MFFKKKEAAKSYAPAIQKPMLHKSICTGETAAGFRDITTGKFVEIMLVKDEKDLQKFMNTYGIETRPDTEY